MSTACPNINSDEWKELVESVGEPNAWAIFAKYDAIPTYETGQYAETFKELSEKYDVKTALKTVVIADLYTILTPEVLVEADTTNYEDKLKLSEKSEQAHKEFMNEIASSFTSEQKDNVLSGIFTIYNTLLQDAEFAKLPYSEQRQTLRKFFIKNMYSIDGNPVPFNVGVTASKLEMEALYSESDEVIDTYLTYLEENNIEAALPINLKVPTTYDFDMTDIVRQLYYDIFRNWDTTISEFNNFTEKAWSQQFEDYLPKRGMVLVKKATNDVDGEGLDVGSNEYNEKVYDKSHLEDSRKDSLSAKVKAFLSDIEADTVGLLGVNDRYDLGEVYTDVVSISTGVMTYKEFVNDLKKEGTLFGKEHLAKVYDKLIKSEPDVQSNFWHQIALHHQEFILLRLENDNTVKLINSNQYTKRKTLLNEWQSQMFRNESDTDNSELFIQELKNETVTTYLNQSVAQEVIRLHDELRAELKQVRQNNAITDAHIEKFEQLVKTFGMFNKATDIKPWVKQYISAGIRSKGSPNALTNKIALEYFLNGIQAITKQFKNTDGTLKNVVDITPTSMTGILGRFADMQAKYDTNLFGSFVNGENKTVYPENLRTALSEIIMKIRRGQFYDNNRLQDVYFSPLGLSGTKHRTLWYELFQNNDRPIAEFKDNFVSATFDVFKELNQDPEVYADFVEKNSYEVRLNLFFNNGNAKYSYINLPTQADRSRLDAIQLPRHDKTGINFDTIVKDALIQEMMKVARNQEMIDMVKDKNNPLTIDDLYQEYHYKVDKKGKITFNGNGLQIGGMFSDMNMKSPFTRVQLEDALTNNESKYKPQLDEFLSNGLNMFNDFVASEVTKLTEKIYELDIIETKVVNGERKFINKYGKETDKINEVVTRLDKSIIANQDTFNSFLKSYIENNLIHKNEMIKAFRIDKSFAENYGDFIKRFGTVSTPGYMLMLQGDIETKPDYGFLKELNEIVINDIPGTNEDLYKSLKGKYDWAESYNPKKVNGTDAQGWMSIDAYRAYQMGIGEWDMKWDETAYLNYKDGGEFKAFTPNGTYYPRIKPIKPYHEYQTLENGMMVMHSIKNSYMVLLRDFTKNNPSFEDLRQRMESEGAYAGLPPVHVVNTVSTRKLAKGGVYTVTNKAGEYANAKMNILDGTTFRIPQIKPDSELASDMLFGSQSMRLIMSHDQDNNLFNTYQNVVSAMVRKSINELYAELGYKPEGFSNTTERNKFLLNVKNKLIESADSSNQGFTKNQLKALDIIDGEFRVPLSFPAFSKRYEQLLFSLFRNEIMNQSMNGKQVVQAAELGTFTSDEGTEYHLKSMMSDGKTVTRAQILVSADVAKKLGYKKGDKVNMVKDIIGYRIPTQGKNSMLVFEIVDVLPDNYESTVIVPAEITTQMGSDFDIDSLFLMMPNIEKVDGKAKRIDADLSQTFDENTDRKVLQNAVFNIFEQVLLDPKNYSDIMKPLDGDTLKDLISEYGTEQESAASNSFNTEIDYQLRNKDGNAGIGIYANALIGHVTGQHIQDLVTVLTPLNLYFGPGTLTNLVTLNPIYDRQGNLIEFNFSQHMTAAVDNAKTPLMKALNDNSFTSPITVYMLSMGATLEDAFVMRNHPVIKRLTEHYMNKGYTPGSLTKAIIEVAKEYDVNYDKIDVSIIPMNEIIADTKNKTTTTDINYLLNVFENIYKAGQDLVKLNKALLPNRISDMSQNSAIQEFIDAENYAFGPATSIQVTGLPSTIYKLNGAYRDGINAAIQFSKEFFPFYNSQILSIKDEIRDVTGKMTLNKEQHNNINELLYLWMFTDDNSPLQDTFTQYRAKELLLSPNNIGQRLKTLKTKYPELFSTNILLSLLVPKTKLSKKQIQKLHFVNAYANDVTMVDKQIDAFQQLLNAEEQDLRDFAKDLIDYTLLTTGFTSSAESLIRVIPIEYWQDSQLVEHFKAMEQLSFEDLNVEHIADQIVKHNVQTKNFLQTVSIDKNRIKQFVKFSKSELKQNRLMSGQNENTKIVKFFRVYEPISKSYKLYQFKHDDGNFVTYEQAAELGEKYNLIEMNLSGSSNTSILNGAIKKGEKPVGEEYVFNLSDVKVFESKYLETIAKDKSSKRNFLTGLIGDEFSEMRKKAFDSLTPYIKNDVLKDVDAAFSSYLTQLDRLAKTTNPNNIQNQTHIFQNISNEFKRKQLLESKEYNGDITTQHLVNVFKSHGVDVEVLIDDTIEGFGEVEIKDNKTIIKLRSTRQVDTEYHEFAHIYIEMLESEYRDLIDDGIAQLPETFIAEIQALYPELSGRELAKEALVTAIGRETIEIANLPKWRIWLNRLWYATRKLFGLANNNVAKELAMDLVVGRLKSNSALINRVTLTRQQKAEDAKTSRIIAEMLANLDEEITLLQQQYSSTDVTVLNKKYLKSKLEKLIKNKDKIESEVQATHDFIHTSYNDALRIAEFTEKLKNTPTQDRHLLMKEIAFTVHSLNKQELLLEIEQPLRNLTDEKAGITKTKLNKTLEILRFAKQDIMNFGIPAMADALLPYSSKDVVEQVEKMIEKRESGEPAPLGIMLFVKNSEQYQFYKREFDKNMIGATPAEQKELKEDFDETVKQLEIEKIKSLNPTRENIISILKEGFTENNLFSQWMDPTIYSSDTTIQLFTSYVKDQLYKSRDATLIDRDNLIELFNKVTASTGSNPYNVAQMNDMLLENVNMISYDRNGNRTIVETLSLVQELDVNKFYTAQNEEFTRLHKKYNIPEFGSGLDFEQWVAENLEKNTEYKRELSKWYRNNTEGKPGWRQLYEEKKAEKNDLMAKKIIAEENTDAYYNYELMIADIDKFLEEHVIEYGVDATPIKAWSQPKVSVYTNPKYIALKNNKAQFEYYTAIKNFYFEQQDKVGSQHYKYKNAWDDYTYIMPSIRKTDQDRLIEEGTVDYVKDKFGQLNVLDTDSESVEYNKVTSNIQSIPVYYNGLVDQKEISRDIFKSMLSVASKANDFKAKAEILGHINTFDFLLGNRKNIELDNNGRAIIDLFKKRNNAPQTGTIMGYETTEYKHFKEFIDHIIYGKAHDTIQFKFLGKEMEANKLSSSINKFSAYNVFPFNFLQGVANVAHGNVLIVEEALAGQFFTFKDYRKGVTDYVKYLPGIMNDIGKNRPESFLGQLIEYFDAQEGQTMAQLTENIFGSKFKNVAKAEQLMFLQRSGELQLATVPLLAMLYNNKITTKDGKEIPLIEAFEMKNGKLQTIDNVEFTREDKRVLMNKVHGLNRSLQGIYDKFNRSALSRKWYGKLLLLFRSWMLANYRRNFGYAGNSLRVDHEMGQIHDGIFRTVFQYIMQSWDEKKLVNYKSLADFEKRNMVKAITRLSTITGAYILGTMLMGGEDDEWARNYAYYQIRRLRAETSFWLNPLEGLNLLQSPAAGTLVVEKTARLVTQLFDPFGEYERKTGLKERGDNKLYWRIKDLLPVLNNIDKIQTPEESVKYLERIFS
jgi:hypothetical protein